jgi:transposase
VSGGWRSRITNFRAEPNLGVLLHLVVLDRLKAHRTAARLLDADVLDLSPESPYRVAWFPGYAPRLNPVEHVWGHTKYADLANYIPEDIDALPAAIDTSLGRTSTDQRCSVASSASHSSSYEPYPFYPERSIEAWRAHSRDARRPCHHRLDLAHALPPLRVHTDRNASAGLTEPARIAGAVNAPTTTII